jgi:transcriptional regulator with XRE-family HTH domain
MSVKERIREFLKSKSISERAFCLSIGVSTAYVGNIRMSIQPDKLDRIAQVYPELNLTWLMTGQGEMVNSAVSIVEQPVKRAILNPMSYEGRMYEREVNDKLIESLNKVIATQEGLINVYERENQRLREKIEELERQLHNPDQHSKAV